MLPHPGIGPCILLEFRCVTMGAQQPGESHWEAATQTKGPHPALQRTNHAQSHAWPDLGASFPCATEVDPCPAHSLAMRRQLGLGVAIALLLVAPAAHAASCGAAPYFVCLAATAPSNGVTNPTSLCQSLQSALAATTSNAPSWPTTTQCLLSNPTIFNINVGDKLFYYCGTLTGTTPYSRLVSAVWAMTMPTVNSGFKNKFQNMYDTATNRNQAAATLWSYFSCRSSKMPSGTVEETWQRQYYTPGQVLSPPPPAPTGERTAVVLTGSSSSSSSRRLLQDAVLPGSSVLDARYMMSSMGQEQEQRGHTLLSVLDQLDSIGGPELDGIVQRTRRQLQQSRTSPPPPFRLPPFPPGSVSSATGVTIVVVQSNITVSVATGLLSAANAALTGAGLVPVSLAVTGYAGGASFTAIFNNSSSLNAFLSYIGTQPHLDQFVYAAVPCGLATTLIISDASYNAQYYSCNGSSLYGYISPLPSMCCGPRPPSPPSPAPPLSLDNATVSVFTNLGVNTITAYPSDPLPPVQSAPEYLIVAPYLAPSFITNFLADDRGLAQSYTDFVSGGGVLLVLASSQSSMALNDVCSAPFALLRAVLGPTRLRNCSCGSPGPNDVTATLNYTAATAVLGLMGAEKLAAVQGPDFPVTLAVVGGMPLTCTPGMSGRDDYDVLPVNTGIAAAAQLNISSSPTNTTIGVARGPAGSLNSAPSGYRILSCAEATAYQSDIEANLEANEVCGVQGGDVSHIGVFCDVGSEQRPNNLTCLILAPLMPPPPAPAPPSPPPLNASGRVVKLSIDEALPAGYRAMTCAEAQQYQASALAVLNVTDNCTLYSGTISATVSAFGSTSLTCRDGNDDHANCQLAINPSTNVTAGSALIKAWPLGSGWVIYAGANVNAANTSTTYADISFWNQFILSVDAIAWASGAPSMRR